jgi:hypothetical protein
MPTAAGSSGPTTPGSSSPTGIARHALGLVRGLVDRRRRARHLRDRITRRLQRGDAAPQVGVVDQLLHLGERVERVEDVELGQGLLGTAHPFEGDGPEHPGIGVVGVGGHGVGEARPRQLRQPGAHEEPASIRERLGVGGMLGQDRVVAFEDLDGILGGLAEDQAARELLAEALGDAAGGLLTRRPVAGRPGDAPSGESRDEAHRHDHGDGPARPPRG